MLSRIRIENFKSFRTADLPLSPLTVLIGANASGKSNAIEAIRFLSLLAQGRRLDDIFVSVQREDVAIRGTMRNLVYQQGREFALGCSLENTDPWRDLRIAIAMKDKEMRIIGEQIESHSSNVPLYRIKHLPESSFSHEVQVAYNNFARGGRKPTLPCTDRQAIFTQLDTPSRFRKGRARNVIPSVVGKFQNALKQVLFLDPSPRQMREYSFINDNELLGDGSNLSSVLYDLCTVRHQKSAVLDFIRYLPEQDIQDIDFIETPRSEVMVQLAETFGGHRSVMDAPVLSDGTLRVLAVAAALLSAREGALVVVEEIDNGVHPHRAGRLLERIQDVARERGLRVLLTSHNPALLDTLPEESIPNIVCCYRDPEAGDSRLTRLQDLHRYPELVAHGPIGQLMTKGILERFLKERPMSEEARREERLKWLESLEADYEPAE